MMSWLAYDEIACQRWDKSLGASDSDLETLVNAAVERANIYISLDTRTAPEF